MKKYKAGWLYFNKENEFNYYTDDFQTFYKDNDEELSDEALSEWAICVNSPWSQINETYEVKLNCKDAYTKMDANAPLWKCKYHVIGYDAISASIFGYGDTEVEALKDCKNHFEMLQDKYNPDDMSF